MDRASYRQLRGLALHFRRNWPQIRRSKEFSRGLFGPFGTQQGTTGRCRWCETRLEQPGRKWHEECSQSYRVATGQSVTYLWPEYSRPRCPCGEAGTELDHQEALVLAWTSGDPRRIIRASAPSNLMWLCQECHRAKTTEDTRALAEMRSQQVCLLGLIPASQDHKMGRDHWVCVKGGLAGRLELEDGRFVGTKPGGLRGPVTFRPTKTTCPRCLVAMEHLERGRYGAQLGMPTGWYLDVYREMMERRNPTQLHGKKGRKNAGPGPGQMALKFT